MVGRSWSVRRHQGILLMVFRDILLLIPNSLGSVSTWVFFKKKYEFKTANPCVWLKASSLQLTTQLSSVIDRNTESDNLAITPTTVDEIEASYVMNKLSPTIATKASDLEQARMVTSDTNILRTPPTVLHRSVGIGDRRLSFSSWMYQSK